MFHQHQVAGHTLCSWPPPRLPLAPNCVGGQRAEQNSARLRLSADHFLNGSKNRSNNGSQPRKHTSCSFHNRATLSGLPALSTKYPNFCFLDGAEQLSVWRQRPSSLAWRILKRCWFVCCLCARARPRLLASFLPPFCSYETGAQQPNRFTFHRIFLPEHQTKAFSERPLLAHDK